MLKLKKTFVRSGDNLTKIHLCVYVAILTHLTIGSVSLLSKDFSKSKDPNMQAYAKIKWKLITTWFNLLTGPYLLLSIYCSWMKLNHKAPSRNVKMLDKVRNFLFSSVLLPVTAFADIFFWRLYYKDRTLLMPLSADEFISIWDHHIMHTVSLLFVLFDLVSVPRTRPKNIIPHLTTLTTFVTLYVYVCFNSVRNGEYVYPGIKTLSSTKKLIVIVYIYIAIYFYYTAQWFVVDIIWARKEMKKKIT